MSIALWPCNTRRIQLISWQLFSHHWCGWDETFWITRLTRVIKLDGPELIRQKFSTNFSFDPRDVSLGDEIAWEYTNQSLTQSRQLTAHNLRESPLAYRASRHILIAVNFNPIHELTFNWRKQWLIERHEADWRHFVGNRNSVLFNFFSFGKKKKNTQKCRFYSNWKRRFYIRGEAIDCAGD